MDFSVYEKNKIYLLYQNLNRRTGGVRPGDSLWKRRRWSEIEEEEYECELGKIKEKGGEEEEEKKVQQQFTKDYYIGHLLWSKKHTSPINYLDIYPYLLVGYTPFHSIYSM